MAPTSDPAAHLDAPTTGPRGPQLRLVLGTNNEKKRLELERLLLPYPNIQLASLQQIPDTIEVEETGTTFAENAILKAREQAVHLRQWVLAEDSGLCVDALDGEPGVYSARFSGPQATDESNNALLLERLIGVPKAQRTAHYVCFMALADPLGKVHIECHSRCCGRILTEPRGSGGFGYDPLFEIQEYHQTFAEMGPTIKSVLSHRARANRIFVRQLMQLLANQWTEIKK